MCCLSLGFPRCIHTSPAEIPLPEPITRSHGGFSAKKCGRLGKNPRHSARQLTDQIATALLSLCQTRQNRLCRRPPRPRAITANTPSTAPALIHHLVFAADVSPAWSSWTIWASRSSDGKKRPAPGAKWEADFLAKCRTTTVVFIFWFILATAIRIRRALRPWRPPGGLAEDDLRHRRGRGRVAQCAGSPQFQKQFPQPPNLYLGKSQKRAGPSSNARSPSTERDGAYQRSLITSEFMTMTNWRGRLGIVLATGDQAFQKKLLEWFIGQSRHAQMELVDGCMTRTAAPSAVTRLLQRPAKSNPTNSTWASSQNAKPTSPRPRTSFIAPMTAPTAPASD